MLLLIIKENTLMRETLTLLKHKQDYNPKLKLTPLHLSGQFNKLLFPISKLPRSKIGILLSYKRTKPTLVFQGEGFKEGLFRQPRTLPEKWKCIKTKNLTKAHS
jgi:hypothetical protein